MLVDVDVLELVLVVDVDVLVLVVVDVLVLVVEALIPSQLGSLYLINAVWAVLKYSSPITGSAGGVLSTLNRPLID